MSEPHYFEFSRNWHGADRLCASCDLTYAAGQHIEITTLKPYTSYVCPVDTGNGHSSKWTGAYHPTLRGLQDHLCVCGQEFVEEDRELWRLSWEMDTGDGWRPVTRIDSHHSTKVQREGLLTLAAQGEQICNVQLTKAAERDQRLAQVAAEAYHSANGSGGGWWVEVARAVREAIEAEQ